MRYALNGTIQAEGVASFRNKAERGSVDFGCIAAGDSLFRLDLYSPLGGTLASLRVNGTRYRLKAGSRIYFGDAASLDTILMMHIGIPIPARFAASLFTARPPIPDQDPTEYKLADGTVIFSFGSGPGGQELFARKELPSEARIALGLSTLVVQWSKYRDEVPFRAEVKSPSGELLLRFRSIAVGREQDPDLFRLDDGGIR